MANNQPTNAVVVIPDDSVNIPNPGVIISGTNTGAGTTLTDVGKGFTNAETNPKGFNINGGDVVYDSAGAIAEIRDVINSSDIALLSAIAAGTYEIYKGNQQFQSPGYSLFVGTGGNLRVLTVGGETVTLNNIGNATFIPLQVQRVYATGTTAADIIAMV